MATSSEITALVPSSHETLSSNFEGFLSFFKNMRDGEWGSRGELWLTVQFPLYFCILVPPTFLLPRALSTPLFNPSSVYYLNVLIGAAVIVTGLWFSLQARMELGRTISPFPKPVSNARLIINGWYKHVRHPIYFATTVIAAGITILTASSARLIFTLALLVFNDLKTHTEEKFLVEKFGQEYRDYQSRTKKLLPYIY